MAPMHKAVLLKRHERSRCEPRYAGYAANLLATVYDQTGPAGGEAVPPRETGLAGRNTGATRNSATSLFALSGGPVPRCPAGAESG